MPGNSRSSRDAQRHQGQARASGGRFSQVPPSTLDSQTPSSIVHDTEATASQDLSVLARHRRIRRRDHDPLGMRIEDTLRELDEQSNALSSALREPLPQMLSSGNENFGELSTTNTDFLRRSKRRKLDGDSLARPFPHYGYAGRVIPGRLQMQVELCGGGPYGGGLTSGFSDGKVSDILEDNNQVFTAESTRCNLLLAHCGETAFSLTTIIIRSPTSQHYDAGLQEGLIFVSMDREGLTYRTERYDIRKEDRKHKRSRRNLAHSVVPSSTGAIRHENASSNMGQPSTNRRHNSWQQEERTQTNSQSIQGLSTQSDDADSQTPSSPQIPYEPEYLGFSVTTSTNIERGGDDTAHVSDTSLRDSAQQEYLDDLFNRISSSSRRMDDQRASPPPRRLPQFSDLIAGMVQSPADAESSQDEPWRGDSNRPFQSTDDLSSSSHLTSPSSSGDELGTPNDDASRAMLLDRQIQVSMVQAYRQGASTTANSTQEPTRQDYTPQNENYPNYRRRLLRDLREWRHKDQRKPLTEPRVIEWYPNKIQREGMGKGPSGMPHSGAGGSHLESQTTFHKAGPLQPHARFFIRKKDQGITLHFDPPVSGRYIFFKTWAPPGTDHIDIQEISAYGYAGPRLFPQAEFM